MIKKTTEYKGTAKNGKFIPDDRELFKTAFYQFENLKCQVTVSPPKRSQKQNSYMWSTVYELIRDACGYLTQDEVHDEMRMLFWFKFGKSGEKCPNTTKKMNTTDMEDYLAKVRVWASEFLNIYIPLPNEK